MSHILCHVDISLKAEIELKMMLKERMKEEELEHSANDISNIYSRSNAKFEISTLLIQHSYNIHE